MVVVEAAEADQAEAEDPAVPAVAPVGGSSVGAKSVPSALRKSLTSTTKRSTRFDGSSQNGPRSSLADAPVFAPNTSAPFGPPSSGPGRSHWCLSWLTTPTRAESAAKRIRFKAQLRIN